MKKYKYFVCAVIGFLTLFHSALYAQGGDQILDGIGETALISRYMFNGQTKDWSRNNLHASIKDVQPKFVNDEQFGTVLSLEGDKNAFLSIPADGILGEESLSICSWVYLRAAEKNQSLFDFGKSPQSHLLFAPRGIDSQTGALTQLFSDKGAAYKANSAALELGQWNHVAVVINIPSKSVSTFVNAKLVSELKNVELDLSKVFDYTTAAKNRLYIGKSLGDDKQLLNAKLYDFRIYRVALSDKQLSRIFRKALRDSQDDANEGEKASELPKFPSSTPQLYNQFLSSVSDVKLQTTVGFLPRLPAYVKGVYSNGIPGPKVRVIWPSPKDNSEVLKTGQYSVTGVVPGTDLKPKAIITVTAGKAAAPPKRKLEAFRLDQVSLNSAIEGQQTKFIENRNKFLSGLAATDPDSFLYMFRNAFGQTQPKDAEPLGVWDSQETKLRGHATGHYLTAIAQAYASTAHDKNLQANFSAKMDYMVSTLYQLAQLSGKARVAEGKFVSDPGAVPFGPGKTAYDSDLSKEGIRTDYENWGKGFISAYPPDQFIMLENGATYGGQKTQIWAPYYTLHKILAGLMDVYEVSNNTKALETAKGMGDWVYTRMKKLPTATLISMWNRYIAGEFGGMNEAMARLYRITNDPHYLEVAQLFDNIKVFYGDAEHTHGLAKNVDTFRGLHANQHIPQIVGALEMYRDSNRLDYFNIADNFWYKAVNDYMYSIGGVAGARNPANAECFIANPATIYENGLSAGGQNETCATYNMLKLTGDLFLYEQRAELMDYYERALYNHILASVAENSPANTYHVPLRPGSIKQFGNPHMTGFTCCNGTAIESNTKFQNAIYFRSNDNNALYVNLYVASSLNWTQKKISIEQSTDFPNQDFTKLNIKGNGNFELKLRVPHWATKGFFVSINGKEEKVKADPGSYASINRKWKDGDLIEIRMPFAFHLEPVMDQQNIASLFYGPVLLAAQEPQPRKDWRKVTFDAKDIGKSISGDPKKLEFNIDGVLYKPFYDSYNRHSVYLDVSLK